MSQFNYVPLLYHSAKTQIAERELDDTRMDYMLIDGERDPHTRPLAIRKSSFFKKEIGVCLSPLGLL